MLAGMIPALMSLIVHRTEYCHAHSVGTGILLQLQDSAPVLIWNALRFVSVHSHDAIWPGIWTVVLWITVCRNDLIDLQNVSHSGPAFLCLERKLRQGRLLAAYIEHRHRNAAIDRLRSRLAIHIQADFKCRRHGRQSGKQLGILLIEIPAFASAHGKSRGIDPGWVYRILLLQQFDEISHFCSCAVQVILHAYEYDVMIHGNPVP